MTPFPFCVSLVIDDVPTHPYKAEILLLTLMKMASVPPEHIFVHYVDRVRPDVVRRFKDKGVNLVCISPYLDGKYCNKLQQLPSLLGKNLASYEGVFLCDVDIAIAAPLHVEDRQKVWGKTVDLPNPPLPELEQIFRKAGAALPAAVPTDFAGPTLAGNFNGGFLYVPSSQAESLSRAWRQQTEFLFAHPEFSQRRHIIKHADQIGLALALGAEKIPFGLLPARCNLPVQFHRLPNDYDVAQPVVALHYHDRISPLGLLDPACPRTGAVGAAVEKVNHAIATAELTCFGDYKRSLAAAEAAALPALAEDHPLRRFLATLPPQQRPKKIILHAGTPKTGTTSLQFFLYENREVLRQKNIVYPDPAVSSSTMPPKHQSIVLPLQQNDAAAIVSEFRKLFATCDANYTLIISTEGIYNHWWDYPAEVKAMLRCLASAIPTEVWVWFREPVSFMRSLYIQGLKNATHPLVASYGRDLGFNAVLDDPWFVRHLDYVGFMRDMEMLIGAENVRVFAYSGDTIADFMQALGLDVKAFARGDYTYNTTPSGLGVAMLRLLNRFDLPRARKKRIYRLLQNIDRVLPLTVPFHASPAMVNKINLLSGPSWALLQNKMEHRNSPAGAAGASAA